MIKSVLINAEVINNSAQKEGGGGVFQCGSMVMIWKIEDILNN